MEIVRFTSEYPAAAALAGTAAEDLRARDAARSLPWHRWLALDAEPVAMTTALLRPDDRWFLSFAGEPSAFGRLVMAASEEIEEPLHITVAADETEMVDVLEGSGFETEVVNEQFRVGFSEVLDKLERSWLPTSCRIIDVAEADPDRLFVLDNELRGSVPGVEGWRGNRDLFDEELTDPAAYKVAVCDDAYVGLARIWNNSSGPAFGLVGVVPRLRGGTLAGALLREVLVEASDWGHDTFTTGTSVANRAVHPHLSAVGESLGLSLQMIRRGS